MADVLEITRRCIRIIKRADVAALFTHGLVIAIPNVFGDCIVKESLVSMCFPPGNGRQLRVSRLEKRLPLGSDGAAFLGTDHIRLDPIPRNASHIGKCLGVDQGDQPVEGIGLPLVGSRRQHEEIRRGFTEPLPQFEPGHLVIAAAEPVGFIHDHQVPTGRNQVLKTLLGYIRPSASPTSRADFPVV